MITDDYKNIGRNRIKEILEQGLGQIEFIETVFREWVKLNQMVLKLIIKSAFLLKEEN